MRVVHVTNAYTPCSGGIRTTVHALGHGYRAAGHDFVLVVPGQRSSDEQLPWGRRVTIAGPRVPGSGGYRVLADLGKVRAVLDDLQPDRLEISDRLTLRGLGRWAAAAGVPSTMIAHERVDGILRAFSPLGPRAAQLAADRHNATTAQRFDRVVTTTRFAAQEFARIGIPTDHVPLGVDLDLFRPVRHPQLETQSGTQSGTQTGSVPLLVLCSRLSREKRPDLAIDALRVLLRAGTPARLVIAGSGPLSASLGRRARGLPVEMVGQVVDRSSVAYLLGSADVVLAPGPVETFGLAALEALACGTPVVAASTSAVAELVGGGAGCSARPEPPALAAAVARMLAVPTAQRRQAARARAESYPWSRTTETMLALHGIEGSESPGRKTEKMMRRSLIDL
ncbi:MAG: alpha,6-mannosyltransferase [Actinomycetota bacterium]|nr:alpha,6-mannosyltransferase [Actinomycetota bacterium]